MKYEFPKDFLWGAATASHQVEGNNLNDWAVWEKENAGRLAGKARSEFGHLPIWKNISEETTAPENYISGSACDHYHKYKEDFALAKSLGHNATRFSIEWSRIEPSQGKFDEKEIEHYRDAVKTCRELGLEPFVTLWHWTIPLWLRDKGGVSSHSFANHFAIYAKRMAKELPEVKFWITLNEPEIYTAHSYFKGVWPPQKKSPIKYLRALKNLIRAHKKTYKLIKEITPLAHIGIAKNNIHFEPADEDFTKHLLAFFADIWWNNFFLWRIRKFQDFIGLNHYFHNRINYGFNKNRNEKTSDMGWELCPEAIYHCLIGLKKYGKPIYITENGLADTKDEKREWFIKESLKNVHRAIKEGTDVRGYLHWSLMDNFEWDKGFWPRFGLIEIDYKTLERRPRPSAYAYKKIIEDNGIIE